MNIFIKIFVLFAYITFALGEEESEVTPTLPNSEQWWGPIEEKTEQNTEIRPFEIQFEEEMICYLRERINSHRNFTASLEGVGFEYGFHADFLDSWLDYWANDYNFSERVEFLNQFPQYKTNIQGLDIHFIRVKPEVCSDVEVVPLLLLHGWPGSVREFYGAIPLLTAVSEDRDFAVEVIVPSIPGFGFSTGAVRPGLGAAEMAVVLRNLMHRLGFEKFYIQGGDFGALIANNIVTLFPKEILGYHTNFALSLSPSSLATWFLGSINPMLQSLVVEPALADRLYPLLGSLKYLMEETGYLHLQATKPDTLGVAMSDSPAGLLAYIFQSIQTGSRRSYKFKTDGGLHELFSREELIDNLMYYWYNNAFTTAIRLYSETFNLRTIKMGLFAKSSSVPTWTIHAKDELVYQSPEILKYKFTNHLNSTILDDLGHFLAMENPQVYTEDVIKAITAFRKFNANNCKDEL